MASWVRRIILLVSVVFIGAVTTAVPSTAQTSTVARVATSAPAPQNRAARTSRWVTAKVNRTKLAVNDVLIITFTVNNFQAEAIKSYPFRPTDADITYSQDECWAKRKVNSVSLLYPKQVNNYRVMAGYTGWDKQHPTLNAQCASVMSGKNVTIDHPWRWGIGEATLQANGTRTITGRVRFTKKGVYTVFFGLVRDYIGYPNATDCTRSKPAYNNACYLEEVTITVGDVTTATRVATRTRTAVPTQTDTPTPSGPTNTAGPATDTPTASNTRVATNTKTRTATRPARTATKTRTRVKTATPRATATANDGEAYPIPSPYFSPTRTRYVPETATPTKTATIETDTTPTEEIIW
jgi:hypothetical protein